MTDIIKFEARLERYIEEFNLYKQSHYSRGKTHYVGDTISEAFNDIVVLLAEVKRLTVELDGQAYNEFPEV